MRIFFAINSSGCAFWRCRQPANMIKKLGLAEVDIFAPEQTNAELTEEMVANCDLVVHHGMLGIPSVAAIARYKELGKTVVCDYDDLMFSVSPFNPAYKTLGLKEIKVKFDDKEEYLYKDGVDGFNLKNNYFNFRSWQDVLKSCDGITTTTSFTKNSMAEYVDGDRIYILPNSIDFNLFKPFPKQEEKQLRIGWTASDSHGVEIWMMKRIMRRLLDKYKDRIKFVELGNLTALNQVFNNSEIEFHPFVPLDVYPLKLASLQLDIGLCPLANEEFNWGKSALKWSEYAAVRVPTGGGALQHVRELSLTGHGKKRYAR